MRDLAMARWKTALTEGVHLVHFKSVLAGIMLIEDDLIPYLKYWERSDDQIVFVNLAQSAVGTHTSPSTSRPDRSVPSGPGRSK